MLKDISGVHETQCSASHHRPPMLSNISDVHETQSPVSHHRPPMLKSMILGCAIEGFVIGAATVASLVMNKYQVLNSGSLSLLGLLSWSGEVGQPQRHCHLAIIPDPGPVHLVVACLVYSTAVNVFYHIHKKDRYQLGIVACGALGALAIGWASKLDTRNVITGLGTWAVMASLLLSAAFHKLLREYGAEARISL